MSSVPWPTVAWRGVGAARHTHSALPPLSISYLSIQVRRNPPPTPNERTWTTTPNAASARAPRPAEERRIVRRSLWRGWDGWDHVKKARNPRAGRVGRPWVENVSTPEIGEGFGEMLLRKMNDRVGYASQPASRSPFVLCCAMQCFPFLLSWFTRCVPSNRAAVATVTALPASSCRSAIVRLSDCALRLATRHYFSHTPPRRAQPPHTSIVSSSVTAPPWSICLMWTD